MNGWDGSPFWFMMESWHLPKPSCSWQLKMPLHEGEGRGWRRQGLSHGGTEADPALTRPVHAPSRSAAEHAAHLGGLSVQPSLLGAVVEAVDCALLAALAPLPARAAPWPCALAWPPLLEEAVVELVVAALVLVATEADWAEALAVLGPLGVGAGDGAGWGAG